MFPHQRVSKTDWHSISRVLLQRNNFWARLLFCQALCIQVLSAFHLHKSTPGWRDATIRISQMSWWVLADSSAWGLSQCSSYLNSWILFLPLPPALAASISSWVSIPRWAPSWLSLLKTAHAPSLSKPLCDLRNLPHTAELQQPSLSSTAPSLWTISPGWTQQSQVSKFLILPIPGVPRTGPKKKLRHAPGPIKSPQGRWPNSAKPCVTALSTPWLKDFFLKHLFQWIPSPLLDRLDMGTKGLIVIELLAQRDRASSSLRRGSLSPTAFSFEVSVEILQKQESWVCAFFVFLRSSYTNIGKIDKRVNTTWYMIIMECQAAAENNRKDLENRKGQLCNNMCESKQNSISEKAYKRITLSVFSWSCLSLVLLLIYLSSIERSCFYIYLKNFFGHTLLQAGSVPNQRVEPAPSSVEAGRINS